MTDANRHVVVGRLRKPHGLKGDCTLFPLTDSPESMFSPGHEIWLLDLEGRTVAGPLTVERSRSYHREWLVKFAGVDSRDALEPYRGLLLGVPQEALDPLAEDEVYLHDLIGMAVVSTAGEQIGAVTTFYELPHGIMLDVKTMRESVIIPYRPEMVVKTDIQARTIVIDDTLGFLDDNSEATD